MESFRSNSVSRGFLHAAVFTAATAAPQIILLLMNIYYYSIASGECKPGQLSLIYQTAAVEGALLIFYAAASLFYLITRRDVHLPVIIATLLLPVIYLWVFCANFNDFWPWLPAWIASSEHLAFYQFAFTMPAVIYSLMRLSLRGIEKIKLKQILIIAGLLFGVPLFWYVFSLAAAHMSMLHDTGLSEKVISITLIIFFILTTAALLFALFRLLAAAYNDVFKRGKYFKTGMIALVGIILPIGGLILNSAIPFPSDYQRPAFYLMAFFNGVLLCIPETKYANLNRGLFAGRSFFFPFTLYFFLSFLPFIPLSIPALLAAGAGFLILTPFILFMVHIHILRENIAVEIKRTGKRTAYALTAACALLLPLIFAGGALSDRMQINSALEYIYEADYASDVSFHGSTDSIRRVLERQEKMKRGSQLPFIDALYNWIVFDNLVLPDAKANYIHRAFFATPVKPAENHDIGLAGFLFSSPQSPRVRDAAAVSKEENSTEVVLSSIRSSSKSADGYIRTEAVLEMKNTGQTLDEFRADITVSDGVLVSGCWLKVGNEKVPGRVFEKKAALWVYEAIKTTRRDPGILFYRGDNDLLLKVFPFARNETRLTGIEFLYPASATPVINIAGKTISLPGAASGKPETASGAATLTQFIPARDKKSLPLLTRQPHVYLIADRSVSGVTAEDIARASRLCAQKIPGVSGITLFAANYECAKAAEGLDSIEALTDEKLNRVMPMKGSFCADRALRHILMSAEQSDASFALPVLVSKGGNVLREENGSWFARCAPDSPGIYFTEGSVLLAESFSGKVLPSLAFSPVRKISVEGNTVYVSAAEHDTTAVLPAKHPSAAQNVYQQSLGCFGDYSALMRNPSLTEKLRRGLAANAKSSGILNGAAAYIVVENPSQWRILEEKEKQKLNGKDSLEIAQSPEPPLWMLIIILAAAGIAAKGLRSRRRRI
jgi:hypothetical protein